MRPSEIFQELHQRGHLGETKILPARSGRSGVGAGTLPGDVVLEVHDLQHVDHLLLVQQEVLSFSMTIRADLSLVFVSSLQLPIP